MRGHHFTETVYSKFLMNFGEDTTSYTFLAFFSFLFSFCFSLKSCNQNTIGSWILDLTYSFLFILLNLLALLRFGQIMCAP